MERLAVKRSVTLSGEDMDTGVWVYASDDMRTWRWMRRWQKERNWNRDDEKK